MTEEVYFLSMVYWTEFSIWVTTITGFLLLISLILILMQVRASKKSNELQSFVRIVEWLQNEDVRKARRRVYDLRDAGADFKKLKKEDEWQVEIVCHNFDVVADMLERKLISKNIVESWAWTIKESWKIVKPLVEKYRINRLGSNTWHKFQWLAEKQL